MCEWPNTWLGKPLEVMLMSCISRMLRERERALSKLAEWNRILGIPQPCSLCFGCASLGICTNQEYYQQFEVSGSIIACCKRGDGRLLNVTKKLSRGVHIVEHRKVPLKDGGIRDWLEVSILVEEERLEDLSRRRWKKELSSLSGYMTFARRLMLGKGCSLLTMIANGMIPTLSFIKTWSLH